MSAQAPPGSRPHASWRGPAWSTASSKMATTSATPGPGCTTAWCCTPAGTSLRCQACRCRRHCRLFVPRREFLDYLHRYADAFRLPIRATGGLEVTSAARDDSRWSSEPPSRILVSARRLIVATGIAANPYIPAIPDRDRFAGRLIHSVEYRRPDAMNGRRVLVVGAGNSAGGISVELARAGAEVLACRANRRGHRAPRSAGHSDPVSVCRA